MSCHQPRQCEDNPTSVSVSTEPGVSLRRRCERHQLLLHSPPGSSGLQNLSEQSQSVPRSSWPPSQERVTEDRRHGPAHRALRAQPCFSYGQPKCPLGRDNLSGPQLPPLPKRDPPSIPRVPWALSPADVWQSRQAYQARTSSPLTEATNLWKN